jgi:hypothetical protein
MSQRDLVAELRATRPSAPGYVREQVRLIAATATPPQRRLSFTWRRAFVVAVPLAAAVAAAVVLTRPSGDQTAVPLQADTALQQQSTELAPQARARKGVAGAATTAPAPSSTRAQIYGAYLSVQVASGKGVSDGVKRALAITSSLGGYPVSVHASTETSAATADLTLKVPRAHVAEAISRLSALGTIVGEQVDVQDAQAGLNATDRLIARLQKQLAVLRAQDPQTDAVKAQIAALTTRIVRLQRQQAAALRATHYATIRLHVATKAAAAPEHHGHGPLHGLGVAFRWIGIGAIYAFALGGPLVVLILVGWLAARTIRRRREDALLNQA